ncbi:MAG: sigma-54 dependent transcriptional regulator [Candidatus Omnitrophica bacterium]|nr:sigma-54 dependent transcriptional regulator [Candidatus Omnitrophota bacterium]
MDQSKTHILVADDEPSLCAGIKEALEREGYRVTTATDGQAAADLLEQDNYNLVIADVRMPGRTGSELLAQLKTKSPEAAMILMTAYGTVTAAVDAMKQGAYDYFPKPLDLRRLRSTVKKALEYQSVVAENKDLRQRLQKRSVPNPLLGSSAGIAAISRIVNEIAPSDITVLITGESGTGKELVAHSIHHKSLRRDQPFVSVNCAALPEQLLESELFGHVKGAFTGAYTTRTGRFQMAEGGTLFLDEVADMPPKGQGDLLRVIEEGVFQMVGQDDLTPANVRIITATNKNLEQCVKEGRFREDLFYRLNVMPIALPPLRERPEDIPLLMAAFLQHYVSKHKRPSLMITPEALGICQRYRWPGNVRELRNVVERLVITVHHRKIRVEDLPEPLRRAEAAQSEFAVRAGTSLREVEMQLIRQTLLHVSANREEAARSLGISRRALQYKLKKYGLLGPSKDTAEHGA